MVSLSIWMLVAAIGWCGVAVGVSFDMAVRRRRAGATARQGKKAAVIGPFLVLPFLLLIALLPWTSARAALVFTYCWVTPFKLLLLLFANFLLDCPSWTLSHFSHFLLAFLLPVHIKAVQPRRTCVPERSLHGVVFNLGALICTLSLYDSMAPAMRHLAHFLLLYIVLDSPHRIASMVLLQRFGVETEPMFSAPWVSTSLTDFWGKRCDQMANALLRHSIYNPIANYLLMAGSKNNELLQDPVAAAADAELQPRHAATSLLVCAPAMERLPLSVRLIALNSTFFVSGLMHELLYFCLTQAAAPTWQVTAFFIVHGLATSAEISLHRACPTHAMFMMPKPLKIGLTMCFLYVTTTWLFFPPLVRAGIFTQCSSEYRAIKEAMGIKSLHTNMWTFTI